MYKSNITIKILYLIAGLYIFTALACYVIAPDKTKEGNTQVNELSFAPMGFSCDAIFISERESNNFSAYLNGKDKVEELNRDTYREVLNDAKVAGLQPPHHVYARYEILQSPNVRFWKIPDKILAHLGLNENSDQFNEND